MTGSQANHQGEWDFICSCSHAEISADKAYLARRLFSMRNRTFPRIILGLLLLLVTACSSGTPALPQGTKPPATTPQVTPTATSTSAALLPVPTTHPSPGGNFLQLQPDVAVPATCPVNPVYAGSLGKSGLEDVPWIRADPLSSQVTAFLFFVEPTYKQTHTYHPLHTGGHYPDSNRNTKILWILDASNSPDTATITGVKVSSPRETFQQTLSLAGSATPGANYPSIVNVPTPGCWQIQFNRAASIIFWVIGN